MIQLKKITEYIREKYNAIVLNSYNGSKYIHSVEFVTEKTIFDNETLYLCPTPADLGHSLPCPCADSDVYLIAGQTDGEQIPNTFKTIFFSKLPDIIALYSDIHGKIKEETILDHQIGLLYTALYHGNGLKDVIAEAENILKNPINVCDPSYKFIETSPMMKNFPYGISQTKNRFYLSDPAIESLKRNHFESMIYQRHSAFSINSPDYPDEQWIFCAIRIQNVMVGYVAVAIMDGHKPTHFELRVTTALADICAVEMQKNAFFTTQTGMKYETFLTDLLEGQFNDVNMISTRLELLDRKFCKYFCIMVLKCTEPHDSDLFNKRQISNLRNNYPNSMSVVYKDTIVLFINQDIPISLDEKFTAKLKEFAELNHMHVGISQPFTDILKIHTYYKQALHTLELGDLPNSDSCLFFASELFPMFLFQNCDYTGLETGIHHHIRHLQNYDSEYNTEFINTLRAYLDNDRNATKAAEALHIHRSTFFYRIKKIEEILEISFADSKLMFLYELSFKVWDYLCASRTSVLFMS